MCQAIREAESEYGREIFMISDEPYRRLLFDGLEYPHIFQHHERSIVATSHSKDLALPGERIGYIAAHPNYDDKAELIDGLVFCNRTLGFVNGARSDASTSSGRCNQRQLTLRNTRESETSLYSSLIEMGLRCETTGRFYMFPQSPNPDDVEFRRRAAGAIKVLVVLGGGFGLPGSTSGYPTGLDDSTLQGAYPASRPQSKPYR